ncbi:MAG: hypothetical protein E6J90_49730 [Deltaproteobacteria bacterium]|nr:MAG: hypothetical protein E6J90_49730 [Deltaproteobacteria bacterium]TMQ15671.1 MAG: hypothetical protein E6J91_13110 [Deltaproteobacteria bacterium]
MTAPATPVPNLAALMAALAQLPAQVTGREGQAIRGHVERLAQVLGAEGPDAELRARAAAELEQLIAAVTRFTAAARTRKAAAAAGPGGAPGAAPGAAIDLGQLAESLRTFVEFLRAPTQANQAQVEQMVATLEGFAVPRPVPLDELRIDGTVEELAIESARRHGLAGAEARRAVERMKREIAALVRQLEARAQQDASRAQTAAEMERLVDAVVQTGTPLGRALAAERGAVLDAFRRVDLAHMAEGLRVFGAWLSTPAGDVAAHVATFRAELARVLGPPALGDPGRSEAERRADFERDIRVAVDQIFRGTGRGGGGEPGQ